MSATVSELVTALAKGTELVSSTVSVRATVSAR